MFENFPRSARALKVHSLSEALTQNPSARLVDPDMYTRSDVGDFMKGPNSLDAAVDSAIDAGVMSLSEVIFDKTHRYAALRYSFTCGRLCGTGSTALYYLSGGKWHRSKRYCPSWQS